MSKYLPIRSPWYAEYERWPYTRGPNYTRAMFREQGRRGFFTAQPMNRMPALQGLGDVNIPAFCGGLAQFQTCASLAQQNAKAACYAVADPTVDPNGYNSCVSTKTDEFTTLCVKDCLAPTNGAQACYDKCNTGCVGDAGCFQNCFSVCTTPPVPPVPPVPPNPDPSKKNGAGPAGGGGATTGASFFSDFFQNPTKMIGTLAVVGGILWYMSDKSKKALRNARRRRS